MLILGCTTTVGDDKTTDDTDTVDTEIDDTLVDTEVLVETDDTLVDTDETGVSCTIATSIPHDVSGGQADFDAFSWQSFLAVNAAEIDGGGTPMWSGWSSTADYLNLVKQWETDGSVPADFPAFGEVYYPQACLDYCEDENLECSDYQVIEQVGKVNDAIFEADSTGLSKGPVIASNGTFLRYEIRINQSMYDSVTVGTLYDIESVTAGDVNLSCGTDGGDEGVMNVKLAWMDMTGMTASDFYTEERLVFTDSSESATGLSSCEAVSMGLVGMHIAHKTLDQQSWVWSTFEHVDNAPDCGAYTGQSTNTACPTTVATDYNFYAISCQDDTTAGACQDCNTPPAGNDATCSNGYCVDQPPNAASGLSRLCRQVPVDDTGPYSDAFDANLACQTLLGTSVWGNYMLISTQWFDWDASTTGVQPSTCSDVADQFHGVQKDSVAGAMRADIHPLVDSGASDPRPVLGNTSMESYERSNCMGCHSKGALTNSTYAGGAGELPPQGSSSNVPTTPTSEYGFTDFSWWLAVQVPEDGI